MGIDNRLTAHEIAALGPGAPSLSSADFARPRPSTGTVVRVCPTYLVVASEGPRGGTFIEN